MATLLKTLPKKYYDIFLNKGEVFLTRIGYYRMIKDPVRKDDLEGTVGFRMRPTELIKRSNSNFPWLGNLKVEGGYIALCHGAIFDIHETLSEVLVYCVSEMSLPDFGDSTFEISNPNYFGKTIYDDLKNKFGDNLIKGRIKKIVYGDFKDNITSDVELTKASSSAVKSS